MIAKAIPGEGADALAARTMAHAAVNAALAKAQGNNALAGAAGAATAEMMAPAIIASLGWDQNNLSETQKQTVSALSTLAAGLAGGLAGGSTESVVSGAQAGKTTTENNYLSEKEAERKAVLERKEKAGTITPEEKQELADTRQTDKARDEAIKSVCTDGNKGSSSCGALVGPAQEALKKYGEKVTYSLIYKDLYPQDAASLEGILQGLDAGSISRDKAISAIAAKTHRNWNDVAKDYDRVMQTQAIAAALAGVKGFGREPPSGSAKPVAPVKGGSHAETKPSSGAESPANGLRLNMQLAAEEAAGSRAPTKITSYSQHALEQITGRDGGIGVSKSAMDNAWLSPLKIDYVPSKYGPTFRYTGKDAVIVVNQEGKVVTGWAKSSSGTAK